MALKFLNIMAASALAVAATVSSGCAFQKDTSTGFIKPTSYRGFIIDPVSYTPGPRAPRRPNDATVSALKSAYQQRLQAAFAKELRPAAKPAPDVLRVRATITGYEPANVWLNILTSTVIGPVTAGGAATEAEVVDSLTGARIAALATHSNGTPFLGGPQNYFKRYGHARDAFGRHARKLVARVEPNLGGVQK